MSSVYRTFSFGLWCCCIVFSFVTTSLVQGFTAVDANNHAIRGSPLASSKQSSLLGTASTSEEPQTKLELFSPCKINLFLRIIRKREDGFHDLASLFQAIGFGDTLELAPLDDEEATSDEFTCNMPGVPVDSTNLVLRALELMREKTGVKMYFASNLIKQVPAQAGLGGGSANAATAMWGANELMGKPASVEQVSNKHACMHALGGGMRLRDVGLVNP
jgi:4-diphosphocytidyl-2-C-methyl-D-erythritol kinase